MRSIIKEHTVNLSKPIDLCKQKVNLNVCKLKKQTCSWLEDPRMKCRLSQTNLTLLEMYEKNLTEYNGGEKVLTVLNNFGNAWNL